MSTMILDDETFRAIEKSLLSFKYAANGSGYNLHAYLYGFLNWNESGVNDKYNKNNKPYDGIFRFCGVLRANNARAYRAAYSHHEDVRNNRTPKYKYLDSLHIYKPKTVLKPIDLLKILQCVSYNLDDHPVKELNRLIGALKDKIIGDLPEYKAANWG